MESFLARYQQGEFQHVWSELDALGSKVHSTDIHPDVLAVAIETMRRVRYNIEMLIPHLEQQGYEFGYEWMEDDPCSLENIYLMQLV